MDKKVLITGATGLVGSALIELLPDAEIVNRQGLHDLCFDVKDKFIIHLAAKVGGVKANTEQMADFYMQNSYLNEKLLEHAYSGGAKKVVSVLSSCVYPDSPYVRYPMTEEQLHMGPPHSSNFGYAYSKRMLDVMSRAYRQQHGCNFITAIPNNLFGKNDNFHLQNGHVIPALIRKVWEAKINNAPYVECWGDGKSLREFTYAEDIAKILIFLLENYNESEPINIGNTEEYSIKAIMYYICHFLEYKGEIIWNLEMPSGQFRKPTSNKKLLNLGWKKEDYTSVVKALQETCNWVKIKYPHLRGIV